MTRSAQDGTSGARCAVDVFLGIVLTRGVHVGQTYGDTLSLALGENFNEADAVRVVGG